MQAPLINTGFHAADSALDADASAVRDKSAQKSDHNSLAEAGRALAGVFLVGLVLWAAIILGIRAAISGL